MQGDDDRDRTRHGGPDPREEDPRGPGAGPRQGPPPGAWPTRAQREPRQPQPGPPPGGQPDPGATHQAPQGPAHQVPPGDPGATRQAPQGPAPAHQAPPGDPGATRQVPPGDPGATRHVPPGDPGATRHVPPGDPGATRHGGGPGGPPGPGPTRQVGAPNDPGATRRVGPGDQDRTQVFGGAADARAPRPDATRMLPQPVGGPELLGGRYRLEGLIGQGGMADVHRATDTRLNRPVAVKIFGPGNDPTADQRFRQEAQVMANLNHPGLVGVHDFAVEAQRAYLVMELVDGPTLRQVIESERLPADDIRRLGLEVAQTLAYCHEQGVTHRDVKPSNILIDGNGRARLADFGVAQLLGTDGHTAAGEIVGTPAYLAPEQVRGSDVGPPADVYGLGLVLLEAWTGRREYQGDGIEGAGERLTRSPVVPRDLPEPLRGAVSAMTSTDPSRRPDARGAASMLTASAAAPPPPPPAGDDDPPPEPGSSKTGRWVAIGAFVVALLVLLIGLLLYNNSSETQTPPRTSESSSAPAETTESSESATPTESSESPTSGNNEPGFTIPQIPGLPSSIPTELPSNIPTELPHLPSNLPDPGQLGDDARGFWDQVNDWWKTLF